MSITHDDARLLPQLIGTACRLCVEGVHECSPETACGCSVCGAQPPAPPAPAPAPARVRARAPRERDLSRPPAAIRRTRKGTEILLFDYPDRREQERLLRDLLPDNARVLEQVDVNYWRVARAHFRRVLDGLVKRFGWALVFTTVQAEYHPDKVCTDSCQTAHGDYCVCVCGGEFHGTGFAPEGEDEWKRLGDGPVLVSTSGKARVYEHQFIVSERDVR